MRFLGSVMMCLVALAGCKGDQWIEGQWLQISESGKPGVCHEFLKGGVFTVHAGPKCTSDKDQVLSGRWELKKDNKLAILRYNEQKAHLSLITEKTKEKVIIRGALAGSLFRIGKQDPVEMISKLEQAGVIKVKALPVSQGCEQLSLSLAKIKALPAEESPRMLRQKDQVLKYFANAATGNPKIEKVVYAMNHDEIEWIALHLAPAAFNPPGPQALMEESIGEPVNSAATGTGEKRQHIIMWKAYCAELRSATNADIDVTLFSTTGKKRGTIYLSENVVSALWEDLVQMTRDPAAQATEEEDGMDEEAPASPPAAAAVQPQPAAPAPAAKAPAPAAPAPAAKVPTPTAPVPAAGQTGAIDGDDDL